MTNFPPNPQNGDQVVFSLKTYQWNGSRWISVGDEYNASDLVAGTVAVARGGTGSGTAPMIDVVTAADATAARGILGAQATLTSPVTSPAITGVSTGSVTGVVKCSQAQYDAITPTTTVLYIIV
jgi:hypothetical protein